MRTLKVLKWISLVVFIAALIIAVLYLSRSVRFHKNDYSSSYGPSSSYEETKGASGSRPSSGTETTDTSQGSTAARPTGSTKPQSTETAAVWDIYEFDFVAIGIPCAYADSLAVYKWIGGSDIYHPMLGVYEKVSREESIRDMGEAMGMLFEIGYVKISEYDNFAQLNYPGSHVFAKDSTRYYIYMEPTDYQFYRSDGGTSAEMDAWQAMQEIWPETQEYFLEINDVEKCTVEDRDPQQGGSEDVTYATEPVQEDCNHCEGTGFCSFCLFGDCPYCYGKGREDCVFCIGMGDCGTCGGNGYVYKGTGLSFRKEQCSRCDGSGDCNYCNGWGYSDCIMCSSTGNCNICGGTGFCEYCGGSGKK